MIAGSRKGQTDKLNGRHWGARCPQGGCESSHVFLGAWKAVDMPSAVHLLRKELMKPCILTSGQPSGRK